MTCCAPISAFPHHRFQSPPEIETALIKTWSISLIRYSDRNSYSDRNGNANSYGHGYVYTDTKTDTDAKA